MMAKRVIKPKEQIIKAPPDAQVVCDDVSFQNHIILHVKVFGFADVVTNIIEAYRGEARRYNKAADALEKRMGTGAI